MDSNTIIIGAGGIGSAITLDKNKMGSYSILDLLKTLEVLGVPISTPVSP